VLKNVSSFVLDGYGSGETDFVDRLRTSGQQVQDDFALSIRDPIVAVLSSTDQTAVLRAIGHSDRVDKEGTSREQRRAQELQASIDRVNSALDGIYQLVAAQIGAEIPTDWGEVTNIGVTPVAAGAAVLVESADALSEEQRQRNRRVELALFVFLP
jgi:hypothetical protein